MYPLSPNDFYFAYLKFAYLKQNLSKVHLFQLFDMS